MPYSGKIYDELHIKLNLTTREYEEFYRGSITHVLTYAQDGRSVKFPANILRPFLTHSGIQGDFIIRFDPGGKLVDIQRA